MDRGQQLNSRFCKAMKMSPGSSRRGEDGQNHLQPWAMGMGK